MMKTMLKRCLTIGAAACLGFVAVTADAAAQNRGGGTPNALQGFSQNRNQPIKIESNSLEVRDKDKVATFIDNVKLTQGDTILETKRLIVFYDEEPAATAASTRKGPPMSGGGQNIRRLEAKGGVVVTQRDQTAVGDEGVYDMKTNSVILTGKVVITQGQNVISGDRLKVDLATGNSVVEASSSGAGTGRVQSIIIPGSAPQSPSQTGSTSREGQQPAPPTNKRPSSKPPAATSERTRPQQPSNQPLRLN